jgi:hypothetical protein
MLHPVAELYQLQEFDCPLLDLFARPLPQMQRQGYIFETVQSREKIEELENESDLVAPDAGEIVVGKTVEVFSVN